MVVVGVHYQICQQLDFSSMNGGYPTNVTTVYDWDGSSWTTGTAMPTAFIEAGCCGPGENALVNGGYAPAPNTNLSTSYERSGASWTAGGTMNTARYVPRTTGTKAAALSSGGVFYPSSPSKRSSVESYDGSSWTTETSMPAENSYGGAAGTGSTSQLYFGGDAPPGATTNSFKYDGTSWTANASLANARNTLGGFGTATAALASCGNQSSPGASEEYNNSINTFTAAAWASAPSMNTARDELGSAINAPAPTALAMGGYNSSPPSGLDICEEYNGTAWSESGDLNNITWQMQGAGTQTAAVSMGGAVNPFTIRNNTEEYNGTAWSNVNVMPTATWGGAGAGSQTAALVFGGNAPGIVATTFEYDGTNYSPTGALNTARTYTTGFGIQTAALCAGGNTPSKTGATEKYNGTVWANSGSMITARDQLCGGGVQTDGLVYTGTTGGGPAALAITEGFDGTAWSTRPSLAQVRIFAEGTAGATSSASAICYGGALGAPGGFGGNTEEFTNVTETVAAKTLTTS